MKFVNFLLAAVSVTAFLPTDLHAEVVTYTVGNFVCDFYNSGDALSFASSETGTTDWNSEMLDSVSASLDYWNSIIGAPAAQSIKVAFVWESLGGSILGGATPTSGIAYDGFTYTIPELLWRENMTTEVFLSNNYGIINWSQGDYAVVVRLSSDYISQFYFGASAENIQIYQTDFQTVLTHEIGHSMGFMSGSKTASEWGSWALTGTSEEGESLLVNVPIVTQFDGLMVRDTGDGDVIDLWEYQYDIDGNVVQNEFGIYVVEQQEPYATGEKYYLRDKVNNTVSSINAYNPSVYSEGSSMSHIDAASDPDALMQFNVSPGEIRRELSDAELGVMGSIGWNLSGMSTSAVPEPSIFGVFCGIVALASVGMRRRRR